MENNHTANKIKALRHDNQMTQKQLADLVGVSNKAISKWENGEGLPDIENLKRLSNIFNISIDDLVKEKVENKKTQKEINIPLLMSSFLIILLTVFSYYQSYFNIFANVFNWGFENGSFFDVNPFKELMGIGTNFVLINIIHIIIFIGALYISITVLKKETIKRLALFEIIPIIAAIILITLLYTSTKSIKTIYTPIVLLITQIIQGVLIQKEINTTEIVQEDYHAKQ